MDNKTKKQQENINGFIYDVNRIIKERYKYNLMMYKENADGV